MSTRRYDFAGVETSALPTVEDAVLDSDTPNWGQVQDYVDTEVAVVAAQVAAKTDKTAFLGTFASVSAAKAIGSSDRADRQIIAVERSDGMHFYEFDSASSDTGDDDLVLTPSSGTGRWKKVCNAGLQIQEEGSAVGYAKKMNFIGSSVTAGLSGDTITVTVTGGGGGGSGGGTSDPVVVLLDAEANGSTEIEVPGEFIDDFEEDSKGTLTNMAITGSKLSFSGSNLTGSVQRDSQSTKAKTMCSGVAIINLQALAPKATTIVYSAPDRTIEFDGDVTGFFPTGKKVIAVRKYLDSEANTDGKTVPIALVDETNGLITFTISSASFSSGVTTVVVSSAETEDLSFGLSASDYQSKLRICPYNYLFKSNTANATPSGGDFETMTVTDCYGLDTVSIAGTSYFSSLTDAVITGSADKLDGMMSKNGTYGFIKMVEEEGSTDAWHFWYSKDQGYSWSYLGTKTFGNNITDEDAGGYGTLHNNDIFVGDSGKVICAYRRTNSTQRIYGVYTDLSAGTPTLNDMPGHTGTNSTNTTGEMFSNASSVRSMSCGWKAGDDSFVAFGMEIAGGNKFQVKMWDFSGSSPSYLSASDTGEVDSIIGGTYLKCITVTGSGTSHRTHVFGIATGGTTLNGKYFDQGSSTANSYTGITSINMDYVVGFADNSSYLVVLGRTDTTFEPQFAYLDYAGTTWSASKLLSGASSNLDIIRYNGWSATAAENFNKTMKSRVVLDPVNGSGKSALFIVDVQQPDDIEHPIMYEVRDITSYQGVHISNYTVSSTTSHRASSAAQKTAQTFLMNTNRLRSIGVLAYQVGAIAPSSMIMKIYPTSAGAPDTGSAALYTSNNTVDPSTFTTSTNGQWVFFNFNGVSLTNATTYAFVIESTFSVSSTNYVKFVIGTPATAYTGGAQYDYDGASWSGILGDMDFEILGEWVEDVGNALLRTGRQDRPNEESQIFRIDNSSVRICWRQGIRRYGSDNDRPITGHPFTRILTWGSGSNQSTMTAIAALGNPPTQNDENLVFNVSFGSDSSCKKNLTTGALDTTAPVNDRSSLNATTPSGSWSSQTADSDFQSGYCVSLNGSSNNISYDDSAEYDLYYNRPFAIEFELKPASISTNYYLVDSQNTSSQGGIVVILKNTSNGDIRVQLRDSSGNTVANVITNSGFLTTSYQVVKIKYDGSGGQIRIYKSSTPSDSYHESGTFTEATYASTTAFSSGNTSGISQVFKIGSSNSSSLYYSGKIGYFKFINGSNSFVYSGYVAEPPIVGIQNLGAKVIGKRMIGTNGSSINSNFNEFGVMAENTALVDSYPMVCKWNYEMASSGKYMHFKIDAERPTALDASSIEGYVASFS